MADKGDDACSSGSSSELIVANVPDQRPLVCIEYPGTFRTVCIRIK